jgi:uncharacterized protein YjlB
LFLNPGDAMPNSVLPVLIYRAPQSGQDFEALFEANGWSGVWRNGIYDYDHYHSNAHEVLGIARGHVLLRLGGDGGSDLEVGAGDVLVLPAGTGHRRVGHGSDLLVVGAYPAGQERYDICRTRDPAADLRISKTRLPATDPVHGPNGPLLRLWR